MPHQATSPDGVDPARGGPPRDSLGTVYLFVIILGAFAGLALARWEGQGQAWSRFLPFALMAFSGLWATVSGSVAYGMIAGGIAGGVLTLVGSVARGLLRDLPLEEILRTGLAGTLLAATLGTLLGVVGGIPVWILRKLSHAGKSDSRPQRQVF